MTERPAFRQFGKTAQKWRVLAEKRHVYFSDLYRSGRWKLYYTEDEFIARMREVAGAAERWAQIAPPEPEPVKTQRPARSARRQAA